MPGLDSSIIGKRFGRLTVLERGPNRQRITRWRCRCDCGNEAIVDGAGLKSEKTKSCGCLKLAALGKSRSNIYRTWANMVSRCKNPRSTFYEDYGGRGITVCERWQKFENFLADMGERPEGMTLDRFPDNNGNYEPGNVRWATQSQQSRNKRSSRLILVNGTPMTLADASIVAGIHRHTIARRIDRLRWSLEDALNTPVDFSRRNHRSLK